MNFKPVFYVSGSLLLILACAMCAPLLLDFANDNADWRVFAQAALISAFTGCLLTFTSRERELRLTVRETFLANLSGWLFCAAFGALPFCLSGAGLNPAQGVFEAMSGITTTGLTAMTGLDAQPHGLLLWRAMLHWLGGMGALLLSLSVLPLLQVSGLQVFRAQSFDIAKILPSASQTATWIALIYAGLTLACAGLLRYADLSWFDAICHAMSALSNGGFSTSDLSAGKFDSGVVEAVLIYFMILAALPFTLYLRLARGDLWVVLRDNQVRVFLSLTALLCAVLTLGLLSGGAFPFLDALRHGVFRAVALTTTSGLTLPDGAVWGPLACALGFLAALIGGCSGSTAGGLLVFRWQILMAALKLEMNRLVVPGGVFQAYYNAKPIDAEIRNAVAVFALSFLFLCAVSGAALMAAGLDFETAFTTGFAALTNAGPALTTMTSALPPHGFSHGALWILSFCMLAGRLEIFGALVILAPRFWRN
jgi:trk system potassium uptake protein TrkH